VTSILGKKLNSAAKNIINFCASIVLVLLSNFFIKILFCIKAIIIKNFHLGKHGDHRKFIIDYSYPQMMKETEQTIKNFEEINEQLKG
jgi:hypothetical protein